MSRPNSVHPQESPITSQPCSQANSRPATQENAPETEENGEEVVTVPSPTKFVPSKDCPAGLESLVELKYVFMKQLFGATEDHPDGTVKYEVLTVFGDRIFIAIEKKEPAANKMFCAGAVPFSLSVFSKTSESHFRKEVLQLSGHPGSFGCGAEIKAMYEKKKLGQVDQDSDFSILRYTVKDAKGKEKLKIIGPKHGSCCSMTMANVVIHEFDIFLADNHSHVGRIAKHWSGVPNNKDVFTRSDIWGVKFPHAYDINLKVLLMSTCFLMIYQTPLTPPPRLN